MKNAQGKNTFLSISLTTLITLKLLLIKENKTLEPGQGCALQQQVQLDLPMIQIGVLM